MQPATSTQGSDCLSTPTAQQIGQQSFKAALMPAIGSVALHMLVLQSLGLYMSTWVHQTTHLLLHQRSLVVALPNVLVEVILG
jgi:hypothetical protein